MANSFLLSKPFVDRIRSTIARVDGTPLPGAGGKKQPAVFEDMGAAAPKAPKTFRIATFDGTWNKGASKNVTVVATGRTVPAMNLFADVNSIGDAGVNCAIAKDGGAWFLIAAEC